MVKSFELQVPPEDIKDQEMIRQMVARKANVSPKSTFDYRIVRRSIDARKVPVYRLRVDFVQGGAAFPEPSLVCDQYQHVGSGEEIHIVGAGPAGYFAALKCLELGLRPIIIERGKDVQSRRRDLRSIQQFGEVNHDSNYCFGEGGAGAYSDGKLYTRSKKRGDVKKILQVLVEHGAKEDILIDAHPHIGSNKLPNIITKIRETIEHFGGQVLFGYRLEDIHVVSGRLTALVTSQGKINVTNTILATGHSARDIYALLYRRLVRMEAKPFALGVRVEHPQALIDRIQYNQQPRHQNLPAASYSLSAQIDGRGVFSFCMCPGGLIVPAATHSEEIVVNGMSLSRRDSPFANAGFVVSVTPQDLRNTGLVGPLACLNFQRSVEKKMFYAGDGSQKAPAQRMMDFLEGKISTTLPGSSYIPGIFSARVDELLPPDVTHYLSLGLKYFGRKMKDYLTNEAVLVGVESRTSAPVRIPRDAESLMHTDVQGLYPCGEGAGYAGGIMSAAIDGQRVVSKIAESLKVRK